jgi:hypothetical protein
MTCGDQEIILSALEKMMQEAGYNTCRGSIGALLVTGEGKTIPIILMDGYLVIVGTPPPLSTLVSNPYIIARYGPPSSTTRIPLADRDVFEKALESINRMSG